MRPARISKRAHLEDATMRSGCHWMIVKQDEGNIMRKKDELLTRYDYRVDEDCVLRSNFRWGWPSVRVFPMDSTTGPRPSTRPAPVVPMLSIVRPLTRLVIRAFLEISTVLHPWIWPLRLVLAGTIIFIQIMGSNTGFCFQCAVSWQSSRWPSMRPL